MFQKCVEDLILKPKLADSLKKSSQHLKSHLAGAALDFGVDPSGTNRVWGDVFPLFPPAPPRPNAPSPALANLPLMDLSTSGCQGSCPPAIPFYRGEMGRGSSLGKASGHHSGTRLQHPEVPPWSSLPPRRISPSFWQGVGSATDADKPPAGLETEPPGEDEPWGARSRPPPRLPTQAVTGRAPFLGGDRRAVLLMHPRFETPARSDDMPQPPAFPR